MKRWSFLAVLASAAVLTWWAGCSNPNLAGGKLHFDQATRLQDPAEKKARFARARDTFRMAVKELPTSGEARMWLGRTYAELGQPDSCNYWLDEAVRVDSTIKKDVQDTRDHYWSVMLMQGKISAQAAEKAKAEGNATAESDSLYKQALGELRKAVIYSPTKYESYSNAAIVLYNLGEIDSAVVNFTKARARADTEGQAKLDKLLFDIFMRRGEKYFEAAQEKANAADSTGARDNYLQAQTAYTKALELRPDDLDLSFRLGVTAYELSQLVKERHDEFLLEAIKRYRNVLKDDPTQPDVLYNMALLLKEANQNKEAQTYAARLVDVSPKEPSYRSILGTIDRALGDKDALIAAMNIGAALRSKDTIDPAQTVDRIKEFGASSDVSKRYRENSAPEEIRTFQDAQGNTVEVWFYWSRGLAYGFMSGAERFNSTFVPADVLVVSPADFAQRGTDKVLRGTVTNKSGHAYTYVRVEYNLYDKKEGEQVGWVYSSVDKLDPKGKWDFEIRLSAEEAKADSLALNKVSGF